MLGNTDPAKGPVTTAIPASVFTNPDVRLAVWFDDSTNGPQRLTPDQRIAPSAYLADGSVTSAKIADGAVDTLQIKNGAVGSSELGSDALPPSGVPKSFTLRPRQSVETSTNSR